MIIYRTNVFFWEFIITFWRYYYAKYIFWTSITWLIFFRFLLYRKVCTEILIL